MCLQYVRACVRACVHVFAYVCYRSRVLFVCFVVLIDMLQTYVHITIHVLVDLQKRSS